MELTTQGFYEVRVFTKDNKREFKRYYVAADSIQEATVIVEDKLKKDNISDSVYINSVLDTGQCLIGETEEEADLPLKNKDVTERIKTFYDAYNELGSNHPFCKAWDSIYQGNENDDCEDIKDVIAYHKLRIIAAALNEGWKPEFTQDEHRYYPYYCFYTKERYELLSDEEKEKRRANAVVYDGLFWAYEDAAYSGPYTSHGFRLAFKNRELAEYAGKQFIDIYKDFVA